MPGILMTVLGDPAKRWGTWLDPDAWLVVEDRCREAGLVVQAWRAAAVARGLRDGWPRPPWGRGTAGYQAEWRIADAWNVEVYGAAFPFVYDTDRVQLCLDARLCPWGFGVQAGQWGFRLCWEDGVAVTTPWRAPAGRCSPDVPITATCHAA